MWAESVNMHCIERTSWLFFVFVLGVVVSCWAAPSGNHTVVPSDRNLSEASRPSVFGDEDTFDPNTHIQFETTTQRVGPLSLEIPLRRRPPTIHTGPGNYLEDRRRQTESRIQELQKQVNFLLEAQKNGHNRPEHDPERDAQTAIQYGLNCQRGDTIIVCLMKKVVILRREVSGIQRDVAVLGKKFAILQSDFASGNIGQDDTQRDYGSGDNDGQGHDSEFEGVTHPPNRTENEDENAYQQDPQCPEKFERVGNICYYVVADRSVTVGSAHEFCRASGGFLARPRDSLTIHDLANHLTRLNDKGSNQLSELWVDGQYDKEDKIWRWNDDQQIDRSIWGISNTPSKAHRHGTCVLLKRELNYLAMPQDCGYHYFFLCEAERRDVSVA